MKAILYARSPDDELIKYKEVEMPTPYPTWIEPIRNQVSAQAVFQGMSTLPTMSYQTVSFVCIGTFPTGELMYVNIR